MNGKRVLIIILGTASAAIWAPQVLGAIQSSQEPAVQHPRADEVGSDAAALEGAALQVKAAPSKQAPAATPQAALRAPAPDANHAPQIEQLIQVLRPFSGTQKGTLGELLETPPSWLNADKPGTDKPAVSGNSPLVAQLEEQVPGQAESRRAERIEAFLTSSPLTAIIKGESGAWALLGGRIVRKDDVLVPDLLKVKSIGKVGMVLSSPNGPIDVPLPAFHARASSPGSNSTEGQGSQPSPSDSDSAESLTTMPPS